MHSGKLNIPSTSGDPQAKYYKPKLLDLVRTELEVNHYSKKLKKETKADTIYKLESPYYLRYYFDTHLPEIVQDIRIIQESLGHKSVKTTMIYTHGLKTVLVLEARQTTLFRLE